VTSGDRPPRRTDQERDAQGQRKTFEKSVVVR
jgi:hypothetical protein